ncbi:MAG: hypothetical protein ABIB47_04780 [Candidatus Woesearchaeota archaeon]
MDFGDYEDSAEQELKRADHLLYVTLKYTRNVDVIKNIIKRLINAYDFTVLEALNYLKVKKIPDVPRMRMKLLAEKLPKLGKEAKFYLVLKEIDAAPFKRTEEFRKNVTLLTKVMNVNIEKVKAYFERTMLFVKTIEEMVKKK